MNNVIAVDIGGTHLRAACYLNGQTKPSAQNRIRTLADQPGSFKRLLETIESVFPKNDSVSAIGVASPGPLNPHSGVLISPPNNKELHNFPLTEKLAEHFGVPVFLDNDANLACLSEWKFGAGQGHANVLYLTVSTGIGGGAIVNNQLLQGFHGLGAELGHIIIDPNGPLCGCGKHGHLESFSSGPAIVRYVREQIEVGTKTTLLSDPSLSPLQIAEAALKGDALAISAFDRAGYYLGIAVANFLASFDPSILIFGGGVSQTGDLLFKPFHKSLKEHIFDLHYLENLIITKAALGDDAGLYGARALAEMKLNSI